MFLQARQTFSLAARLHLCVFLVTRHKIFGCQPQHDVNLLNVREKLFVRQTVRRYSRRLQLQTSFGWWRNHSQTDRFQWCFASHCWHYHKNNERFEQARRQKRVWDIQERAEEKLPQLLGRRESFEWVSLGFTWGVDLLLYMFLLFILSDTRSTVLKKNHRSFFDRYENVNSLKFQDFVSFCESFQRSLKAKILIQGNFVESRALYIAQLIKTNLEMIDRGERTQTDSSEVCQLPQAFSFIKIKSFRDKNKNSIIKNFYQIDETSIRAECLGEFLVSLLNEPLFDTLRSHEQLGYGVACSLRKCSGTLGITITVEYQEDKNSADKIDDKIEEFLGKFADDLKLMSLKDFLSSLRSLMSLKLTPDAELECEVSRHFEEIRNGENIFDRDELEVFEIEKLTKDDVVEFFHETFRSKQHVRKLSVQVIGDGNDDKTDHLLCCDIKDFRGNLENLGLAIKVWRAKSGVSFYWTQKLLLELSTTTVDTLKYDVKHNVEELCPCGFTLNRITFNVNASIMT